MLGGMRKWTDHAQKVAKKISKNEHMANIDENVANQNENPWLSLATQRPSDESSGLPRDERREERLGAVNAPSRWIEVDDRQSSKSINKRSSSYRTHSSNLRTGETKSLFLMQCVISGALVLGVLFMHKTDQPAAKTLSQFTTKIFETDYTNNVEPVFANVFNRFHISLPTFGVHAAIYMHAPLNGKIDADYSDSHPEISIQGTPNEPVLAAGSGIVTKVDDNGPNAFVEIDHGAIGTSIYTGLGVVTVQVHEYVDSGQVIGRMPKGTKNQDLRFAITKNGKYENPHDFIHFSTDTTE